MQVRPYLMADGGNVELIEIDGLKVRLKLNGACGSCPSSMTTMKMGIERRLVEKIPVRPCSCVHLRWRRTKRSWRGLFCWRVYCPHRSYPAVEHVWSKTAP